MYSPTYSPPPSPTPDTEEVMYEPLDEDEEPPHAPIPPPRSPSPPPPPPPPPLNDVKAPSAVKIVFKKPAGLYRYFILWAHLFSPSSLSFH